MTIIPVQQIADDYRLDFVVSDLFWEAERSRYSLARGSSKPLDSYHFEENVLYWAMTDPNTFSLRYDFNECSYVWIEDGRLMMFQQELELEEKTTDPYIYECHKVGMNLPDIMRLLCL